MSSLLRIADDRGRWAVIAADAPVGVPPNDAWRSQILARQMKVSNVQQTIMERIAFSSQALRYSGRNLL